MKKNLSIIHVEDEFREFEPLVISVQVLVEDLLDGKEGVTTISEVKEFAKSSDLPYSWIVYNISVPEKSWSINYIFVREASLPDEVKDIISSTNNIFILDVLRPQEGQTKLGVSLRETLDSISPYIKERKDVVLYTAHQGNSLDGIEPFLPRKISKEADVELDDFISKTVVEFLEDA